MKKSSVSKTGIDTTEYAEATAQWQIAPIEADFGITLLLDKHSDPIQKQCMVACVASLKKFFPDIPVAIITDLKVKTKADYIMPQGIAIDSYWSNKKINQCTIYWLTPFKKTLYIDNDFIATSKDNLDIYLLETLSAIKVPRNALSFRAKNLPYEYDVLKKNSITTLLPHSIVFERNNDTALEFFNLWYMVCSNWQEFFPYIEKGVNFKHYDTVLSFSLTAHILGISNEMLVNDYSYIHMNPLIEKTFRRIRNTEWSSFINVWLSNDGLYVENYKINHLFHYKDKRFIETHKKQIDEWIR
jgi:hypothetical protein